MSRSAIILKYITSPFVTDLQRIYTISICFSFSTMFSWVHLSVVGLALLAPVIAADECQPSTWQARVMETGGINCRFSTKTGSKVDDKTCATIAKKYEITLDTFYDLNPRLKGDCKNILSDIRYCVEGCRFPTRSLDSK